MFNEPIQASTLQVELVNSSSVVQDSATHIRSGDAKRNFWVPNASLAGGQTFTCSPSEWRGAISPTTRWLKCCGCSQPLGLSIPRRCPRPGEAPTVVRFGGDGRVFVAEKSGRIYVYDNLDDATPTLFVDLRTSVHNFWDRGLLGMTLHPAFPAVPYVYVLYAFDAVLPNFPAPRWGTAGAVADGCPDLTGVGCVITGRLSRFNANYFLGTPLGTAQETVLVQDRFQQFWADTGGQPGIRCRRHALRIGRRGRQRQLRRCRSAIVASAKPSVRRSSRRRRRVKESGPPDQQGSGWPRRHNYQDPSGYRSGAPRQSPTASADANARRVVAYGLRNPFRFTIKTRH